MFIVNKLCKNLDKVADLVEICKKLCLQFEGFKKQILYDSIHTTLVNLNIYKID